MFNRRGNDSSIVRVIGYLLKLVGDHGEGLEDGVGGPGDGDYSLGAVPL